MTKEATCTSKGGEKLTCEKCGYWKVVETDIIAHNYENGVCTVCGYKDPSVTSKPSENTSSGSKDGPIVANEIEPDNWYTYTKLDALHVQNCVVVMATSVSGGKGVMVTYYPICKNCHICHTEGVLSMAGPEWGYPVNKIYHCPDCGTNTTVRFELG